VRPASRNSSDPLPGESLFEELDSYASSYVAEDGYKIGLLKSCDVRASRWSTDTGRTSLLAVETLFKKHIIFLSPIIKYSYRELQTRTTYNTSRSLL
jgi:hypothetical protein